MAASKHILSLTEELTCSVCLSLFVEPVRLDCDHNFCKSCIQKCWENQGEEVSCPECRQVLPQRNCTSARVLANLCEKARQLELTLEPEAVVSQCEEHGEKLKLFCEDDHALICVICRDSPAHSQHSFLPVADAVRKYKDQLKLSLDSMENKKKDQSELKQQQKIKISDLEELTESLEQDLSAQFAKIHRYLEDKEKHLIEKLRRQKEEDLRPMEKNLRRIDEELASLEEKISNISVDIEQQDSVAFLQELKRLKERYLDNKEDGEGAGRREEDKNEKEDAWEDEIEHGEDQEIDYYEDEEIEYNEDQEIEYNEDEEIEYGEDQEIENYHDEEIDYYEDEEIKYNEDQEIEYNEDEEIEYNEDQDIDYYEDQEIDYYEDQEIDYYEDQEIEYNEDQEIEYNEDQEIEYNEDQEIEYNEDQEIEYNEGEGILVSAGQRFAGFRGPLLYTVWKEMKQIISPVAASLTLDPNTAHRNLVVSEDRTHVSHGDAELQIPDNPERFDTCHCVLGSQGFTSGKHYWEVEVGDKTDWDVGVARESANRKGVVTLCPDQGYWAVWLRNGKEGTAIKSPSVPLTLTGNPKTIGVFLDYEVGQVTFYNADGMSVLHTFTDTFTEKLFPYFGLCEGDENSAPLKLRHFET
ncbi:nuclear factor 7, brain-like [Scyliorhinus canicula]|uniref:nuclear factor 7, brain-like n=1 Tax=Scyliorhinus canicula TaxID=7830 RepID=UPI0018F5FD0E|nr:nuclear factor 7, brain-like [Scyliorhinus canicula]